jgi:ribonuclease BN (tRNA processing enzyme)
MHLNRRDFVSAAGSGVVAWLWPHRSESAEDGRTRLILLGTKGGPSRTPTATDRHLPSQVILIKGVPHVIDCGLGVTDQLVRAGVPLRALRHIFITHQHSDHNLEYGNLFYTAWATGLTTAVDSWGPPPLANITRAFFLQNAFDIDIRIPDEGRPDPRPLLRPHEISAAGVVLQTPDVNVTAALVPHPPVTPALAFRFDTADRSIVISGDTAYSEALIELAKGADVLVHETMFLPAIERLAQRIGNGAQLLEHLKAAHTSTEEVGRVAAAAGVKLLVMSHLVPGDDPTITDEQWTAGARQHFTGRIVVGRDLMEV